ncbi:cupin domain-containing protein [Magnetospirillum sulfuroxidans]|uniref:Cupin domain-containing protein n=1 Tax=Magnetospirillum sulfuroxidans TaxID=611300 RepID=A0ABS5IGD9_9PROT|nr:cupin domain-containing protein [Magnetospirillum sulfuroxidans]MBR9973498.1 cupin domain-containing protein [Magnetospirillum sulfuroxidans]
MTASAFAEDKAAPPAPSSTVLLKTTTTGDGVPLVYPDGTPQILSRITVFPPHSETVLHRHPIPLYAYILEGELTISTEGQPPRHYKTGDAFMETAGWHFGRNDGNTPTRLLAVYMGNTTAPLSEHKHK